MKKGLLLLMIFILIVSVTGCESINMGRAEIREIEFIRAIAIDKSDKEGQIKLTISTQRFKMAGGSQSEQKESFTVHSEGKTVFEAIRNFGTFLDKKPFTGHLEYIIFGEDIARDGINKYLDFFFRDHQVRLNIMVFIMKIGRAEDLIRKTTSEGKFVFDKLGGIIENRGGQSLSNPVNLVEIMYIFSLEYQSLYLPCLEIVNVTEEEKSGESSYDIKLSGFAIFEKDKLKGHISSEMGRGLNFLRNEMKSGIIVVESPEGNKISLEIMHSKTKFQPEIKSGELFINVKIDMSSNVGEIQGFEDVFKSDTIAFLERQQEKLIKDEVENVINFAQKELELDFFSTGIMVSKKYPIAWEDVYEKEWKDIFPEIRFNVTVNSKIMRTYDLKQPSAKEAGDSD